MSEKEAGEEDTGESFAFMCGKCLRISGSLEDIDGHTCTLNKDQDGNSVIGNSI